MPAAPKPPNERDRLDALWSYELLDTPPESGFDALVHVAADLCDMPIALISLVDEDRQWFKSQCGLGSTKSTHRDMAFCAYAILEHDLLEVPDATLDPRFMDNPLVTGEPFIRFYAGAPLIASDGMTLGTLCVIDRVPRRLTLAQREMLTRLAQGIVGLIAARIRRSEADSQLLGLLDTALAQANQRAKELDSLIGLAGMLGSSDTPADVLVIALNTALRLCAASSGSIVDITSDPQATYAHADTHVMRAPIRNGHPSGKMLVLSRDTGAPYSRSERTLVDLIATMAGLALSSHSTKSGNGRR